jgi:hypothetical protein
VEIDIDTIVIPCTSVHTMMKDSACISRVHRNIIKSLQFSLYRNCFAVKIILFQLFDMNQQCQLLVIHKITNLTAKNI